MVCPTCSIVTRKTIHGLKKHMEICQKVSGHGSAVTASGTIGKIINKASEYRSKTNAVVQTHALKNIASCMFRWKKRNIFTKLSHTVIIKLLVSVK